METRTLRRVVVAALLVVALALAGCAGPDSSGNGTSSPYARPDGPPAEGPSTGADEDPGGARTVGYALSLISL